MIASIQNTAMRRTLLVGYVLFALPLVALLGGFAGALFFSLRFCPEVGTAWRGLCR